MTEPGDEARSAWVRYLEGVTERPGWSISRLAREAGIHRSTIYRWLNGETGSADVESVKAIAVAAGDNVDIAIAAAAQLLEGAAADPDAEALAMVRDSDLPEEVKQELTAELRKMARDDAARRRALVDNVLRLRHT